MEEKNKVVGMNEEPKVVVEVKPSWFKRAADAVKANKKAIITGVIGVIMGSAGTCIMLKSGDSYGDSDISCLPESSYSEDNAEE